MIYFQVNISDKTKYIIGEDELHLVVQAIHRGDRVIVCRGGIFNPSFYTGIEIAKERMTEIGEMRRYGQQYIEDPSEFARLLSGKMAMLSPQARTAAQEEAAREERYKK